MDKLQYIISRCKASVTLLVNDHRDYYLTISQHLEERFSGSESKMDDEIPLDVLNKMIDLDICIELQFYPDTPIGSYTLYHYDLNIIFDQALVILKEIEPKDNV